MVFPAAIREKSLHGVALFCDAHVMSASSGKIRQPCTVSLGDQVLSETFFSSQHFCAGNSPKRSNLDGFGEASAHRWMEADRKMHLFNPGHT